MHTEVYQDDEAKRQELEALVGMLLEELVQDPLWGVRTYNPPRQGPGNEDEILTPQVSIFLLFP